MSGFDDDFGEMVGGGGGEAGPDQVEDPAAEFLAREQEQLGELETELGPLTGDISPQPFSAENIFHISVSPQKSPAVTTEKPIREVRFSN